MLVGEWGEGDGREPSALQPVHSGGVNSYRLLCCDVGAILWDRGGWGREGEEGEKGREGGRKEGGREREGEEGGGDGVSKPKQGSRTRGRAPGDGEVPSHLEVVVLSLLFCLQVEPGQPSQVLLTHCLVHLDSHTEITHE